MRIAITGTPKSGKTTYSKQLGKNIKHTDDLINLGWSEASEAASLWFDDEDINIIEGIAIPRALRKWLARNPEGKPCDKIIYLNCPHVELIDGQKRMAKGIRTVWNEILPDLMRRNVIIEDIKEKLNILFND